ncbi:hypothetical protein RYO59_002058 [Thermosynechococcaceae cyanobacterium Okahandja]
MDILSHHDLVSAGCLSADHQRLWFRGHQLKHFGCFRKRDYRGAIATQRYCLKLGILNVLIEGLSGLHLWLEASANTTPLEQHEYLGSYQYRGQRYLKVLPCSQRSGT